MVKVSDEPMQETEKPSTAGLNIGTDVFGFLKELTSSDKNQRIEGSSSLLVRLFSSKTNEKETLYALKRLIRGVGSSTIQSRSSFFITLVEFLKYSFGSNAALNCQSVLDLTTKELNFKSTTANKEDNDAVIGIILVCGSLIRSGKLRDANKEEIEKVCTLLFSSFKHKTYHQMLASAFFVEMLKTMPSENVESSVASALISEIEKCEKKYNLAFLYIIAEVCKSFPSLISKSKKRFNFAQLIEPENFKQIADIVFLKNPMILMEPVAESIGYYLANNKYLKNFWQSSVESNLSNLTKVMEINVLSLAKHIIMNSKESIQFILSENFVKMMMKVLKSNRNASNEKVRVAYIDFFETILLHCNKPETSDEERVHVVQKLILYPGTLLIENYTKQKIIHQIICNCREDAVKTLYGTYKQIILDKLIKNSENLEDKWSPSEKAHAGFMLQFLLNQKVIQSCHAWKSEELNLLMKLGFFYTNGDYKIIEKAKCKEDLVNENLAEQIRNIFFASLQNKFSTLENENKILYSLVCTCNKIMSKKDVSQYFRFAVKDNLVTVWKQMFDEIEKLNVGKQDSKSKGKKELDFVFSILLMHMGLQLFKEPEMAETAITDLEMCVIKSKDKLKKKTKISKKADAQSTDEEPEWIEVVVDLFLHLLSQNSNTLRNIVACVFPHLCEFLTLSAIHQILEMLNMESGGNPLISNENEDGSKPDPKMETDSESESDEDKSNSGSSDSEKDDDDDDDAEDEENEVNDDATDIEKFRNTLSLALHENDSDDDGGSIDLDDLDEEKGRKLDEILASAFKARNKNIGKKGKKTKRVEFVALMHFRIRVLDLIDIYVQHKPNLLNTLEILIALYTSVEHCIDDEQTPLFTKLSKTITKITKLNKFSNIEGVTQSDALNYFSKVIYNKNKFKNNEECYQIQFKCIKFLIHLNSTILKEKPGDLSDNNIVKELEKSVNDFVNLKKASISINLLKFLFKTTWSCVWNLTSNLIKNGLSMTVRSYRRIQVLELLELLYKNNQLIKQNKVLSQQKFELIEKTLEDYAESLGSEETIAAKEFSNLINLIVTIKNMHKKSKSTPAFNGSKLLRHMQDMQTKFKQKSTKDLSKIFGIEGSQQIEENDSTETKSSVFEKKSKVMHKKRKHPDPAIKSLNNKKKCK